MHRLPLARLQVLTRAISRRHGRHAASLLCRRSEFVTRADTAPRVSAPLLSLDLASRGLSGARVRAGETGKVGPRPWRPHSHLTKAVRPGPWLLTKSSHKQPRQRTWRQTKLFGLGDGPTSVSSSRHAVRSLVESPTGINQLAQSGWRTPYCPAR
jgi:hypothetical protein